MDGLQPGASDALESVHGYPRASVDQLLSACFEERERLQISLALVKQRLAAAHEQLTKASELREHLGTMLLDTQRALDEERRSNERSIEAILAKAEEDAATIRRAAEDEVTRLRGAAGDVFTFPHVTEQPQPDIDLSRSNEAEAQEPSAVAW